MYSDFYYYTVLTVLTHTDIFDQTSYYALFIIVLLMLNWNCLKVTVPHFTVVIYGLHTKSQHLIDYV